jgi:small subunit ribosomal protein S1
MQEEKRVDAIQGPAKAGEESITKGGDVTRGARAYLSMFEHVAPEELSGEDLNNAEWDVILADINRKAAELQEGNIVKGTVYEVTDNEIIVNVGFKSEGSIPRIEFSNAPNVQKGDVFDVYLEKMENQDGLIVLSKEKADFIRAWDDIKESYDKRLTAKARVDHRIKGGLVVKLMGVDAFLPGSQIALRQVPDLDELIGQELECKIIKLNKRRRNIVVSRRVVLEEERDEKKKKLLAELAVGQEREGVVKNITDFGAFVDLGGIDGLLHLTDLTWGRVSHPSEVVAIGDKLKVKILDFDRERERISLGLKQLTPYPWEGVEERYPIGTKMRGKVVSITDYGAFVELEKGIEGLIHISEMSWTRHVKHPSKVVAIGDTVEAIILNVDKEHEKISLGLKQLEPDPWKALESKYPPGTRLKGKVRNLTNFGAFVEIEDGIDGLVHISDMSWAKRVRHPSEAVRKGDELEVVVLEIDSAKRRISLGMKQTRENPWNELAKEFSIGIELRGTITRLLDRGAVVELKDDVEGFVPLSHLGIDNLRKPSDHFDVGMEIPLKVIKIDPQNKRIVLSVSAYLETKSQDEVDEFRKKFPRRETADQDRPAARPAGDEQAGAPADYDADEGYEDDIDSSDSGPAPEAGPEGSDQTAG